MCATHLLCPNRRSRFQSLWVHPKHLLSVPQSAFREKYTLPSAMIRSPLFIVSAQGTISYNMVLKERRPAILALCFLTYRAVVVSVQRRQHDPSPTRTGQHEAADLHCPMLENNTPSTKTHYGVHATARAYVQEVLGVLGLSTQPCNMICRKPTCLVRLIFLLSYY